MNDERWWPPSSGGADGVWVASGEDDRVEPQPDHCRRLPDDGLGEPRGQVWANERDVDAGLGRHLLDEGPSTRTDTPPAREQPREIAYCAEVPALHHERGKPGVIDLYSDGAVTSWVGSVYDRANA